MAIVVYICFVVGLGIRFWLFKTSLPGWLASRVEISTPLTSWKRVIEGIYLTREYVSPYSGDLFHETPIMLKWLDLVLKIFGKYHYLIFLGVDTLIGILLLKIANLFSKYMLVKQAADSPNYSPEASSLLLRKESLRKLEIFVVATHMLNPYSIAVCLARSTGIFHNLLVLFAFFFTLKAQIILSTLCLALATFESFYPLVLCVPAALFFHQQSLLNQKSKKEKSSLLVYFLTTLGWFFFWILGLLAVSYVIDESAQFIFSIYGFILTVPDLSPNIGIFWYFFTEMFEHFRIFFLFVFQINAVIYTVPLAVRLREQPVFLMYILTFLTGVFKSYPSYSDVSIILALLPLWNHLFSYLRNSFIVTCMFICCTVFSPLLWHLWLYAGSANANFYFAITLVFTTAEIFLVTDLLYANLRWEYDLTYGLNRKLENGKEGQVVLE